VGNAIRQAALDNEEHTATHSNTQQHTAAHSSTQQHTETHSNAQQRTATLINTQEYTATHCNLGNAIREVALGDEHSSNDIFSQLPIDPRKFHRYNRCPPYRLTGLYIQIYAYMYLCMCKYN